MDPLQSAARHGPWVLVAGLCVGLAAPGLAEIMRPWLPVLVVILLFVSVLRISPKALLGSLHDFPKVVITALLLQLGAPLLLICIAYLLGTENTATVLALSLMLAAPSIMGSPNISMMLGAAPDHAMRLMAVGTALMPLTILPVFWALPGMEGAAAVRDTSLVLLATISLTAGAALALRLMAFPRPSLSQEKRLEGLSAIVLAVFVVGLMPQVSTVAFSNPRVVVYWAVIVFSANFGAQALIWYIARRKLARDRALPLAIIAGNRNVALFLVSLPPETTAPVLVFIGCYQLPMYLTPLLMKRLYTEKGPRSDA